MCTAINFNGYFGRTLDYECGFGEEAVILPRGSVLKYRHRAESTTRYSIAGMAKTEEGYPLFFDAVNEKGVAMAGLNFTLSAHYPKGRDGDVAVFEFIPYILSQADSVKSAKELINGIHIADTPFSDSLPNARLHWMIADSHESAVIESTSEGLFVYDSVGVLTNEPPHPYQIMNLNLYLNLTSSPAEDRFSKALRLQDVSRGMGAVGLPGDWSSPSRFVRGAFVKENAVKEQGFVHFFRIMSSVAVPKGCMVLESGETEYTRYVSCMDLKKGIYRYMTYDSTDIHEIAL